MRILSLCLLALPALAAAQQQVPFLDRLKGMVDQAAATFQKATAASPKQAAEAKTAQASVTSLTFDNWKDVIQHSGKIRPYNPPEAFMVFITGGNTTCGSVGRCDKANEAWQDSVPWLAGDISAPKLTSIDCESEEMLCGAWAAHIPSIWMILRPQPDQVAEKTRITVHNLNTTTVDDTFITKIHTRREYLGIAPYEGAFHPFDGWIAKLGLTTPMALTLFYLSKVPNWAFMIGLSVFSRYFVSRRMPPAQPSSSRPQAPAGAAGR